MSLSYRQGLQSIINCSVVNRDKFHRFLSFLCFIKERVRRFLQTQQWLIKRYHYTHIASIVLYILFSNFIERAFIGILTPFTVIFDIFNIRNSKEEKMKSNVIFDDFFPKCAKWIFYHHYNCKRTVPCECCFIILIWSDSTVA